MCPSYRVTRDEQHLTRGRANALRLAISGQLGPEALTAPEMLETMRLCVSCKACKRECPTGVDMARMKTEVLFHHERRHGLGLRDRLVAWRRDRDRLRIVDLGAGTGANLRYLAPHLGGHQRWLLIDRDAALLRRAEPGPGVEGLRVECRCLDLAAPGGGLDLTGTDILTAAALMDLVSAAWFEALAARAAAVRRLMRRRLRSFAIIWSPQRPKWSALWCAPPIRRSSTRSTISACRFSTET